MLHIPWVGSSYWVRNISGKTLCLITSNLKPITSNRDSTALPNLLKSSFSDVCWLWIHLCFLVLAKVCAKVFLKENVVCLFLAYICIYFSVTQPSSSVNMTLSVGNIVALIQNFPFPRRVIRIEHLQFFCLT